MCLFAVAPDPNYLTSLFTTIPTLVNHSQPCLTNILSLPALPTHLPLPPSLPNHLTTNTIFSWPLLCVLPKEAAKAWKMRYLGYFRSKTLIYDLLWQEVILRTFLCVIYKQMPELSLVPEQSLLDLSIFFWPLQTVTKPMTNLWLCTHPAMRRPFLCYLP